MPVPLLLLPTPDFSPISAEGVFSVPIMGKPDSGKYLQFTHNCTDAGEFIDERFHLSLFS